MRFRDSLCIAARGSGINLGRGMMVATSAVSAIASEDLLSDRYEALIRVSQAIGSHRDPNDLFRALATELRQVIRYDGHRRCAI